MLEHPSQVSIPATAGREPGFVSTVILYSLAYDAPGIVDDDNIATELLAQIQVSIVLISSVRKLLVEQIVLVKQWRINPEKVQKTIQP